MEKIEIIEIGPRDGFQNLKENLTLDYKKKIINGLVGSGFSHIQLGSFVNPKLVPQMAEIQQLWKWYQESGYTCDYDFLVPTFKNAERAIKGNVKSLTFVLSVSESHNEANVNRTVQDSFKELERIKKEFPTVKLKLDLATAFQCPFEGITPLSNLMQCIERAKSIGVQDINICDTMGSASPSLVKSYLGQIASQWGTDEFILHFHDTLGMGISNVATSIDKGFYRFENSIGGLGGCPFAPGAAGNLGTEDVVYFLKRQGVNTSIDFGNLLRVIDILFEAGLQNSIASHVGKYYLQNSNGNQLLEDYL